MENLKNKKSVEQIFSSSKSALLSLLPETLREMYDILQTNIPSAMNYTAAEQMPAAVEMGYLNLDFDVWRQIPYAEPMLELIRETFSFALCSSRGKTTLRLPYGRVFDKPDFNKLIIHDNQSRTYALSLIHI